MTDDARPGLHSFYCTRRQHSIIGRRAKAAAMTRSRFMVACALHEDAGETASPCLDAEERQQLQARLERVEGLLEALGGTIPDLGMTAMEALEFLVRAEQAMEPET